VLSRSLAYSRATCWESISTPTSGCSCLMRRAASSPSLLCVGGMRTSTMASRGRWLATAVSSWSPSPTEATTAIPSSSSRLRTPSRSSTASSARTTSSAVPVRFSVTGQLRGDDGGPAVRAVDPHGTVERGDAPGQALQSAALRVGPAGPVIPDRDGQQTLPGRARAHQADGHLRGTGMLDHVVDRFADHEVGGRLDGAPQLLIDP